MTPFTFLIPLIVSAVVQFLKSFLNSNWLVEDTVHGYRMPRYGGMPSGHSAFAFSIATLAYLIEGVESISFILAFSLVVLLLDDALRLRIYLGRHGAALARLVASQPKEVQKEFPHLEQRLGHSWPEVIVGAIVGIGLTLLLYLPFQGA